MKRLLCVLLALWLCALETGCGNVFIGGAIRPGVSAINGTVSFVELNTIVSNGTTIQVTIVRFLQNGISSNLTFCGNQTSQFPLNQTVTMNFNPGQPCNTLVVVVIIS